MTANNAHAIIALDVGARRIGVALAAGGVAIASPLATLEVDGTEIVRLQRLLLEHEAKTLVVGLPRNQSGEETAQSKAIRQFARSRLRAFGLPIIFQDESVTSIMAEASLAASRKTYQKADIDAAAAALILQDYLELHRG